MARTLRRDPTRTLMLVRSFHREISRRLLLVSRAITALIGKEDIFGLNGYTLSVFAGHAEAGSFQFLTNPQKLDAFRQWLTDQVDSNILTVDAITGQPWTATYVESAYKKGMLQAYTDTVQKPGLLQREPAFYQGTRYEFLRSAFGQPETLSKVQLLATRSFEQLRGITNQMAQAMNRLFAEGISEGVGANVMARRLRKDVARMGKVRAKRLARTELIYAHAEGQLDSFDILGVEEIGVMAEWSTAGDDRVCSECGPMEGNVFTVKQARGMIPVHPNCRCAWIPYVKPAKTKKRYGVKPVKPKTLTPTLSPTMEDAIRVADDVGSSVVGSELKTAMIAQKAGYKFIFEKPMSESVRIGWQKTYRQRKEFMGVRYKKSGHAFQGINEERLLRVQNANNDNAVNLVYRSILEKNSGGKQSIVLRRPPEVSYAAEQIGGTTHILDSPFMDALKDAVPLPGGINCTSTCGLQGALRHEYGHSLWFKSETTSKKKFLDILHAHTGDDIERGITQYAAANMYRSEEAFCELFSMRTSRVWDASKFPEWVQSLAKIVESDFM